MCRARKNPRAAAPTNDPSECVDVHQAATQLDDQAVTVFTDRVQFGDQQQLSHQPLSPQ